MFNVNIDSIPWPTPRRVPAASRAASQEADGEQFGDNIQRPAGRRRPSSPTRSVPVHTASRRHAKRVVLASPSMSPSEAGSLGYEEDEDGERAGSEEEVMRPRVVRPPKRAAAKRATKGIQMLYARTKEQERLGDADWLTIASQEVSQESSGGVPSPVKRRLTHTHDNAPTQTPNDSPVGLSSSSSWASEGDLTDLQRATLTAARAYMGTLAAVRGAVPGKYILQRMIEEVLLYANGHATVPEAQLEDSPAVKSLIGRAVGVLWQEIITRARTLVAALYNFKSLDPNIIRRQTALLLKRSATGVLLYNFVFGEFDLERPVRQQKEVCRNPVLTAILWWQFYRPPTGTSAAELHPTLFDTVSVPLLALAVASMRHVLQEWSTGTWEPALLGEPWKRAYGEALTMVETWEQITTEDGSLHCQTRLNDLTEFMQANLLIKHKNPRETGDVPA